MSGGNGSLRPHRNEHGGAVMYGYWVDPEDSDLTGVSAKIPLPYYDQIKKDYGWTKIPDTEENK